MVSVRDLALSVVQLALCFRVAIKSQSNFQLSCMTLEGKILLGQFYLPKL